MNTMTIDGYDAVIKYDPEIKMFRGSFIGLNGGADFYADSVAKLEKEGRTSLKVFLEACKEEGIEPRKSFSGKFVVRVDPDTHRKITQAAAAEGVSINQWVQQQLERDVEAA